jgi:hypothetical protein
MYALRTYFLPFQEKGYSSLVMQYASRHKKPMSVAAGRLVAVSPGTWHFGLIHENLNFIEN